MNHSRCESKFMLICVFVWINLFNENKEKLQWYSNCSSMFVWHLIRSLIKMFIVSKSLMRISLLWVSFSIKLTYHTIFICPILIEIRNSLINFQWKKQELFNFIDDNVHSPNATDFIMASKPVSKYKTKKNYYSPFEVILWPGVKFLKYYQN